MSVRVVVTGLGMITPLGIGVEPTWNNLIAGKSGIGPITHFDTTGFETTIAGEIKEFNPEAYMSPKLTKRMDRFVQIAVATAVLAMQDAGLEIPPDLQPHVGSIVGCGLGGLSTIEKYHKVLLAKGPKRITPFFIPMLIPTWRRVWWPCSSAPWVLTPPP
jgi:3-oxoacyl-[acyl-carrier-protein] synthase II